MSTYVLLDTRILDNYQVWRLSDSEWRKNVEGIIRDPDNLRSDYQDERNHWISIRSKVAPKVFARDGKICKSCGSKEDLTIDHIVPLARGGTHDIGNLQVLCRKCNSSKGAK